MQKKIALVIGRYHFLGGLENYARTLALSLTQAGFRVTILTKGKGAVSSSNPQIVFLKKRSFFSFFDHLFFNFQIERFFKKNPHDLVVSMERIIHQDVIRAGFGVHKIFLKQKKRAESTWKNFLTFFNPLHRFLLTIEKKAFENPKLKLLIVNSLMVKKEILENFSIDPKKILLIRNGVNSSLYQEHPRMNSSSYRFLFIGNGYRRKGLLLLLQALSTLERKDWHLDVVGRDKNLPFYQKQAKKKHIHQMVTFHGPQKNLSLLYAEADALVIPSYYDPCSNVTLEALYMGLFVISSSYNGGAELLHPYSGTIIEDLFSPIKIKKSLEVAFDHPKTAEMIKKRRDSVKELDLSLQLDKMVEKISMLVQ